MKLLSPVNSSLPLSEPIYSAIDVLFAVLLNLVTAGAIIGGGFICLFCSF
jgi:hypothetical protein